MKKKERDVFKLNGYESGYEEINTKKKRIIKKALGWLCIIVVAGFGASWIMSQKVKYADTIEFVNKQNGLVEVRQYSLGRQLLVDTETGVLYMKFDRGITVLLNADGSPKLYEGDLEELK